MKQKIIIFIFILCLVGIRFLETKIFYDPFLDYFKNINLKSFPEKIFYSKLILSHIFRYLLNITFSIGIIYFWFKNKNYLRFSLYLFILIFIFLFPIYIYQIHEKFSFGNLIVFYIRRFLIQPILLLFLIPAFYYLKNRNF